jgi:subtilisin family serine protease
LTRQLLAACAVALLSATPAQAARYAVGVRENASVETVAAALESATGRAPERHLADLRALVVELRSPRDLRALPGVAYVERVDLPRRLAFVPNDPLATKQWHLEQDHAFDFWPELPVLPGIKVAVIDSGIDGTHPDLMAKIAGSKSFVRSSATTDQQGHGTFVAGLIAAQTNNAVGVAGIAFPSQLLIAKVVGANRLVSLEAEAEAIRWSVQNGARVINLSLGGLRDPRDPDRDTYSALEAAAVRYAYTRGAVLVAAVGNGDQAPTTPWPYASYPAALPHVLGVSALSRDGSIPAFSNRDPIYNDLTAPGDDIVSTFPRALTAARPTCVEQGYSLCGPDDYRRPEGTSFAAPQVAAAAALLLSVRPTLQPDQVMYVLQRWADDVSPTTGCKRCAPLRDAYSGWGSLNIAKALAALQGPLPAADSFESNDDAGAQATPLKVPRADFVASLDYWDDPLDVYKTHLRKGQRITVTLEGPKGSDTNLVLWKPGTQRVEGLSLSLLRQRAAQSVRPGPRERVAYRAAAQGWYYIQVKLGTKDAGAYRLRFAKR